MVLTANLKNDFVYRFYLNRYVINYTDDKIEFPYLMKLIYILIFNLNKYLIDHHCVPSKVR